MNHRIEDCRGGLAARIGRSVVGIAAGIIVASLCLVGVELVARFLTDRPLGVPPRPPTRWIQLLSALPERDAFLRDRDGRGVHILQYHDYHIYSMRPYRSSTLTVTDYWGARACPDSCPDDDASQIVWMFGGSTMQNLETTDRRSIANAVAIKLKENNVRATVRNFGVGSFQSSMEITKFLDILRRVPPESRASVVVFYDGYNDSQHGYRYGAGNMQADLSNKLRLLVEKDHGNLVRYGLVSAMSERSVVFRDWLSRRLMPAEVWEGVVDDGSRRNLAASVQVYICNTRAIRATCGEFNVQPLFVLQPLLATKQGLTPFEREFLGRSSSNLVSFTRAFYANVRAEMEKDDFLDLSSIFDHSGVSDFYDYGHTGPLSGEVIGRRIGEEILVLLGKED